MFRKSLCLSALLAALLVPIAGARPLARAEFQPKTQRLDVTVQEVDASLHDEWFGVYMQGKKVGYRNMVREKLTENGETFYRERQKDFGKLQVAGKKLEICESHSFDFESQAPFKLFRAAYSMQDGNNRQEIKLVAKGSECELSITTGKVTRKKLIPRPDFTLSDSLAVVLWLQKEPQQGETFTGREFNIEKQLVESGVAKLLATRDIIHQGVKIKVHDVELSLPSTKTTALMHVAGNGRVLSVSISDLVEMRAEQEADAKNTEYSADLFIFGLAKIDQPIGESPRGLILEAKGKHVGLLPDGPLQSIVPQGDDVFLIKIGKQYGKKVQATKAEIQDALAETAAYPISDERVVALAKQAIGDAKTDEEKVKRLCKFVHDYITPSMEESGGAANVQDIIERKQGVCRHFAVLFTCLSRAVGVASREVGGLWYMGDGAKAFGLHQWNEVVLDGCWVQVDAVCNSTALDADRVCLGSDRDANDNSNKTFGKLSFKLIQVERAN